jgi:molybdopterin molybdotransferase
MCDDPNAESPPFLDPRLRGFRTRATVDEVLALIDARIGSLESEDVSLAEACGRVLAVPATARGPVPNFDRAAMDGHAVRGEETFGADTYNPALFRIVGRSRPGAGFRGQVGAGEAVEIATGAPLPEGADTVVPVEVSLVDGDLLRVVEANPPGRHVGRRGEDVEAGAEVLPPGRLLRPQDLGILSTLGMALVSLVRRPAVTIVVTGDELLPAGTPACGDQIADMNSVMLRALVLRDGGVARIVGPLPDDRDGLEQALRSAVDYSDLILVSGGSSTGPEDHAPGIVAKRGTLDIHGVALRPASPTGLGFLGDVPVVLLPGNPVSCLCAYDLFAGRIVRRLGGRPVDLPYPSLQRPLARKLSSALGRVDYARVRVIADRVEPLAISGASILSSTTRADGFVLVPADLEGYPPGAIVQVWLYDHETLTPLNKE